MTYSGIYDCVAEDTVGFKYPFNKNGCINNTNYRLRKTLKFTAVDIPVVCRWLR